MLSWFYQASGVEGVAPHFEVLWIISEFGLFFFLILFVIFFIYFKKLLIFNGNKQSEEVFSFFMFLVAQQGFLQLANPFYFYQFVVVFGIFSGVALAKFDLLSFNLKKII